MTIHVALLRGINVSGHNIIKMAELRKALEAMGLQRVQTYIQSGNIVFEAAAGPQELEEQIRERIQADFGLKISVMVRTAEEFAAIMAHCPYAFEALKEGESIHVSMLSELPSQAQLERLPAWESAVDEYTIVGREVYQLYRQRTLDSKLGAHVAKIPLPATARNWKTMLKLEAMIRAMQE
ncbi:DUF1697 domain-containing protein [Paenibacillus athensensis]|uniref:Cytoplasmic protein n=1 Tax=Paenibacillus athensensis TaxID=1967502 RepID=A0A4Y8Q8X9_9BACL|nr:DUF1697 domain-containing protein [Paenibacillus athensensis]MCD1260141.1 DUF1697 domain-containing protein [Paenibacillus athensensis]